MLERTHRSSKIPVETKDKESVKEVNIRTFFLLVDDVVDDSEDEVVAERPTREKKEEEILRDLLQPNEASKDEQNGEAIIKNLTFK